MGKHFFHETESGYGEFYRLIYCEWCGVVVWNFNNSKESMATLQLNAQTDCKANICQPTHTKLPQSGKEKK